MNDRIKNCINFVEELSSQNAQILQIKEDVLKNMKKSEVMYSLLYEDNYNAIYNSLEELSEIVYQLLRQYKPRITDRSRKMYEIIRTDETCAQSRVLLMKEYKKLVNKDLSNKIVKEKEEIINALILAEIMESIRDQLLFMITEEQHEAETIPFNNTIH